MKLNKRERSVLTMAFRSFRMVRLKLEVGDKQAAKQFLGAGLRELEAFINCDPTFNYVGVGGEASEKV